jgi:hypothetical protein
MRKNLVAFAFAIAAALAASPCAAQPTATYSTAMTKVGVLLADPQARAILDRFIPGMSTDSRIRLAKGMTLKQVQKHAPKRVSDTALTSIDAEFVKLALGK